MIRYAFAAFMMLPLSAISAETLYTVEPVSINAKESSSLLGKVAVATPVTVVERKGDYAKVELNGWTLKEYPSQIFKAAGERVEYASFDEEDAVKTSAEGEKEVAGNVWVKASAQGWVPAASLTADIEGLWKQGKERGVQACSVCHPAPDAAHFTANQWASQLPVKGGRAGHSRAGANALMFKYFQEHAKPMQ